LNTRDFRNLISSSLDEAASFEETTFDGGFGLEVVSLLIFRDLETGGVESFRTDISESLSCCTATLRFFGGVEDDRFGELDFVVADFVKGEGGCFVGSTVSRLLCFAGDDSGESCITAFFLRT